MKKVLLGLIAMAIIALSAVNVNYALRGDQTASMISLKSVESLAQNENGEPCYESSSKMEGAGYIMIFTYDCNPGSTDILCPHGISIWWYYTDGRGWVNDFRDIIILYC